MLNDVLKAKWKQIRGEVKQAWGMLTDNDLDRIAGEWDQLAGTLQEKYSYTKEKAEGEIAEFLENLSSAQSQEEGSHG